MSRGGLKSIVALVTHARHVPAVEREQFAIQLRAEPTGRVFVLQTCHRAEGYLICPDEAERTALAASLPVGGRALIGQDAIRHAIAVSAGRDSVVAGEDQVLHQLRESVDAARSERSLDPALERLFAFALQAGRRARSWRQGPSRSLADTALSSIEEQTGSLRGRAILVVGAGRMGCLTARAGIAAGASVSIANRTPDRAHSLAAATGAHVVPFDPGARLGAFAGVVVALDGPWPIGPEAVQALRASATVVVDLSVPAALPDAIGEALGRRFVSADALALADAEPRGIHDGTSARYEALIDRTTAEFVAWLNGRPGRAAAEALIKRADRERETELAALWRRLPDLHPDAREAIERMTDHLARRLLREPLERLGRDSDGGGERAVRDIFAL